MRIKNIKSIIKTLIFTTIISMSSLVVVFADSDVKNIQDFCNKYMVINNNTTNTQNHYMEKATVDESGATIIKYLDGSWYSYNSSKMEYKFKPVESTDTINFANDYLLEKCRYDYDSIKETSNDIMLSDKNSCLKGFGKHSDVIYTNDLQTDENLKIYAEQWLKDNYNLTLDIPISYENIDGDIGGYNTVTKDGNGKSLEIKINNKAKNINLLSEKFLIHELTHFALIKQGKEYHDGTESFTQECIKNGSNTYEGQVGILHSHLQCTL